MTEGTVTLVTKLQRNGLRADGTYGKVDDLSVSYSGNRISGVSDGAPAVTQNGSMDYPGGNTSYVFTYNAFGAMTSDAGRKITSVTYDDFGNPLRTSFSGGGCIENVYSATGERLRSVQAVWMVDPGTSPGFTARTTLHYRGPVG